MDVCRVLTMAEGGLKGSRSAEGKINCIIT